MIEAGSCSDLLGVIFRVDLAFGLGVFGFNGLWDWGWCFFNWRKYG